MSTKSPQLPKGLPTLCSMALAASSACGEHDLAPTADIPVDSDTYHQFMDRVIKTEDGYLFEGDIKVFDEDGLLQLYQRWMRPHHEAHPSLEAGSEGLLEVGTSESGLVATTRLPASPFGSQQRNITYCIDQRLIDDYGTVVEDIMNVAAAEWEAQVNVNFTYLPKENRYCSQYNNNVVFNVLGIAGDGGWATFPLGGRQQLALGVQLFPDAVARDDAFHYANGVARHELGHLLGFLHEHGRDDRDSAASNCGDVESSVKLTGYDRFSVMHYPSNLRCGVTQSPQRITDSDYRGAINIYGRDTSRDRMVGDFDGDGYDDIVMFGYGWTRTPVYFSMGRSGFRTTAFPVSNPRINAPRARRFVGDFDGDGYDDIVVFEEGFVGFVTYYSLGDGHFTPVVSQRDLTSASFIAGAETSIIVGRTNHDATTDIVLFSPWSLDVYVAQMPLRSRRAISSLTRYNLGSQEWLTRTNSAKMEGDFDGDGLLDIALWSEGWATTPVYFSRGDGGWRITNKSLPTSSHYPSSVNWINQTWSRRLLGDFDGNGTTDIAVWQHTWGTLPIYTHNPFNQGTFNIWNNPIASFVTEHRAVKSVGNYDGQLGDDIVALNYYGANGAQTVYSAGSGWFTAELDPNARALRDPGAIHIKGDFDNDGRDDIALHRAGWDRTWVAFGGRPRYSMFSSQNMRNIINYPREQLNLVENSDFEAGRLTGWSLRQGFSGSHVSSAPGGRDGALLLNDTGSSVSWMWSDPIEVKEGESLCISADTYKTNVTGGGYPRVWARFYTTDAASTGDLVSGVDVETYSDNRHAPENVWAAIKYPFTVPSGRGIRTMRVLLTANSAPTGQLYFDNVSVWERGCPSWVPSPWQPPPPPPPPLPASCGADAPGRAECEARGCTWARPSGSSECTCLDLGGSCSLPN